MSHPTPHRWITLLTDFGLQDNYVGVMKGVMAQIAPQAQWIDLTHDIPPQDRYAARFSLMTAYPYFPNGTIHLAVVDPGVGSARRAIALQLDAGLLVGPDNGIFSGILATHPIIKAVELTNPAYWRASAPSQTFHGRDIFAPAAAHLANGVALSDLGTAIDPATVVHLDIPACQAIAQGWQGVIQYQDRFGNLVTTVEGDRLSGYAWSVQIKAQTIPGQRTYANVAPGSLLALVGSHGWVEIAVNGGSAAAQLQTSIGTPLDIVLHPQH